MAHDAGRRANVVLQQKGLCDSDNKVQTAPRLRADKKADKKGHIGASRRGLPEEGTDTK